MPSEFLSEAMEQELPPVPGKERKLQGPNPWVGLNLLPLSCGKFGLLLAREVSGTTMLVNGGCYSCRKQSFAGQSSFFYLHFLSLRREIGCVE